MAGNRRTKETYWVIAYAMPGLLALIALFTPLTQRMWPQRYRVIEYRAGSVASIHHHDSMMGDLGLKLGVAAALAVLALPAGALASRHSRPRWLVYLVAFVDYGAFALVAGATCLVLWVG